VQALFNTTGQPALMLPLWQAKSGMPLGMQFAGRRGDEETLFSLQDISGRRTPGSDGAHLITREHRGDIRLTELNPSIYS
jgi:hypothetical protein